MGVVKINVDAATRKNKTGIGLIDRDSAGFVIGGLMRYKDEGACAEWAEIDAIQYGIVWAKNNNFTRIILKLDCANVVNRIKKHRDGITIFGHRIREVRAMLNGFFEFDISWVCREK